jgi:uncharacterized protein YycO
MTMQIPSPGDFAVVQLAGDTGRLISLGERLCGGGFTQYDHALIYMGGMLIVEAEPGGARQRKIADWTCGYQQTEWSTGRVPVTAVQRGLICAAAARYVGTGYSGLDYLALAAHHLHLPAPGLKAYIASTGHQICSQLVDQVFLDAGVHLFADGRWPGYVMPSDLAALLG